MTDRPKLIYLARRHPALSRADFPARWRRHGRLGMSLPRWRNIWRYMQCDALPWASAPLPLAADCDGVGLVWYRSAEARAQHVDDADRAIMAQDELETFDRPVRSAAFLAREIVLEPPRDDGITVFCLLYRHPNAPLDSASSIVAEQRGERLRRALRGAGSPAGYTLNLPYDGGAGGISTGLGCIAIDELSFDSLASAERLSPSLAADKPLGIERVEVVLAKKLLLYQASEPRSVAPGALQ
jgi:EthD domain-containing protein